MRSASRGGRGAHSVVRSARAMSGMPSISVRSWSTASGACSRTDSPRRSGAIRRARLSASATESESALADLVLVIQCGAAHGAVVRHAQHDRGPVDGARRDASDVDQGHAGEPAVDAEMCGPSGVTTVDDDKDVRRGHRLSTATAGRLRGIGAAWPPCRRAVRPVRPVPIPPGGAAQAHPRRSGAARAVAT